MSNYDNQVLGTENPNHPANQNELSDRELLTEIYNVPSEVLEIFDRFVDDKLKIWNDLVRVQLMLGEYIFFLTQIKETLSTSENGHCIIVKNQIDEFLKK